MIFPLSTFLLLYILLSDESDSLNDGYGELVSDSGYSGTYYFCTFYLCFEESVVGVLGSVFFAPMGVDSEGVIF